MILRGKDGNENRYHKVLKKKKSWERPTQVAIILNGQASQRIRDKILSIK